MACGEKHNSLMGRWNMEFDSPKGNVYSVLLDDDTLCTSELLFNRDTVYMQVKTDGVIVKNEFVGKYSIKDNYLKVTDRYGKQQECEFFIKENIMTVVDKDDPDKVIMRLRRSEDNG